METNQRFLLNDFTVTHNSSLFNCLSNLNVPAENYVRSPQHSAFTFHSPSNCLHFHSIDCRSLPLCACVSRSAPSTPPTPECRSQTTASTFLCSTFKPASKVPAVLTITDIAGLVKGANEGKGLGNAFLSHIQAVDAIFHLVRAFKDKEIEHVEGSVDPITRPGHHRRGADPQGLLAGARPTGRRQEAGGEGTGQGHASPLLTTPGIGQRSLRSSSVLNSPLCGVRCVWVCVD